MQLYTINATPERHDVSDKVNAIRHKGYPMVVSSILSTAGIDGFTIQQVQGYWEGKSEISYIITVALDDITTVRLMQVAGEIRDRYQQDAVMVTYPDNSVQFI